MDTVRWELPRFVREARWIWAGPFHWDLVNCYALFRKSFDLARVPRTAPAVITADHSYRLYVNGQYVCRGPARGFQSHWPCDEIDIARFLRRGRNVIAIRAYSSGASNFQYITQGVAGLLFAAKCGAALVVSDRTWKARRQDGVARGTVPTSAQLFPQEHVDKRIEADDWMMPGFDDSGWSSKISERSFGCMPWDSLEPRMIPMLAERRELPAALLGVSAGRCAAGFEHSRDVARLRHSEGLGHSPATEGIRPLPIKVVPMGKGRFRSYMLDFGRTIVGSLVLTVNGAKGGEIVDATQYETIDQKTLTPHYIPDTWCRMGFGYRMTCRPGKNQHEFYHPYGFRYLVLTVRGATAPMTVDGYLNWVGYPLERKGSFSSSERVLEQIWDTCAWTQQCCSLDAYVDTPWREQAQWWGDARVQGWNTFHLSGDARLFRRGIHCIGGQTTPNGLTYGHAPTMAHECILPDFTLIWFMTMWDYYWQTGSAEPLVAHRAVVDGALDYFRKNTDPKTGLVVYDERYWLFLDWTDIFKNGYPAVYNLWLLLALEALARLHRVNRDLKAARELENWAGRLRASLRKLLNRDGLMRDGYTHARKPVESTCAHAQTLAIMAGLNPAGEKRMIEESLLPYVKGQLPGKCQPSAYWCTYILSVLAERGYAREVVDFIRERWAPMVAHGSTWENFKVEIGNNSHSHAWSAHPLFHLMATIGGISQSAPAWKQITFRPTFIGERGGATVPSPAGLIRSSWIRRGDTVHVGLQLPKGVTARVELPGMATRRVSGRSTWKRSLK